MKARDSRSWNATEELGDAPWPVQPKHLLTPREKQLYQSLQTLYPSHRVFIQVALSQLIDVPKDHPQRVAIRNRFERLVADFVLCRDDLTVVAVIELDDSSHRMPIRQAADARKTKALRDAGVDLIRIPEGTLPSDEYLRSLIDQYEKYTDRAKLSAHAELTSDSELQLADDWGTSEKTAVEEDLIASKAVRNVFLKLFLSVTVFAAGWLFYLQLLPPPDHRALQRPVQKQLTLNPMRVAPPQVSSSLRPPVQAASATSRAPMLEEAQLQKEQVRAWTVYYQAPPSCEHPTDWNAQVECGNQYIRAKRVFEAQWAAAHGHKGGVVQGIVLDNMTLK